MNSAHLHLTFSLDHESTFDTLEAVLAIARRGRLRLAGLHLQEVRVALDLHASERDLLDLFEARLRNVIGVHDITH